MLESDGCAREKKARRKKEFGVCVWWGGAGQSVIFSIGNVREASLRRQSLSKDLKRELVRRMEEETLQAEGTAKGSLVCRASCVKYLFKVFINILITLFMRLLNSAKVPYQIVSCICSRRLVCLSIVFFNRSFESQIFICWHPFSSFCAL